MTLLRTHPERLPAGLPRLALLLACLTAACGPRPVAAPEPGLARLTGQAAPYLGDAEVRRLDLVADFSNPTPEELRGAFLEVTLVDGPTVTLEVGDIPPLGEGRAWLPLQLERPVGPDAFFGGPAEVVIREDATTLPALWLVKRFEGVRAGFQVKGEARKVDWTEAANEALPGWNQRVSEEALQARTRADEAVGEIAPAVPATSATTATTSSGP